MKFRGIIILLCVTWNIGFASDNYIFNQLSIKEGLSHPTVQCFAQDSLGRIWIGTRTGLNCYDGNKIRVFLTNHDEKYSLLDYTIKDLLIDGDYLWITSGKGVSRLNLLTLRVDKYSISDVTKMCIYNQKILVSTLNGLFQIDTILHKILKTEGYCEHTVINTLFVSREDELLIISNGTIYQYNKFDSLLSVEPTYEYTNSPLNTIFEDRTGNFWIGTNGDGIFHFNPEFEMISHYLNQKQENSLCNNVIYDIIEDKKGNIWIATSNGLSVLDPERNKFQNYTHSKSNSNSLSDVGLMELMEDNQGNIWIGTYYGGVNYCSIKNNFYTIYSTIQESKYQILNNRISHIIEDSRQNLWVSTEGGGIFFLDRKNENIFELTMQDGLSSNNTRTLFLDGDTYLYVGTHLSGFNRINLITREVNKYVADYMPSYLVNTINCFVPYQNQILVGTNQGLLVFDPENETLIRIIEGFQKIIISLYITDGGTLWIGTNQGLYVYDKETMNPVQLSVIGLKEELFKDWSISSVMADQSQNIWIGTYGNGLICFNFITKTTKWINTHNSDLPSDYILTIKEADDGVFWFSTSSGLCCYKEGKGIINNHEINGGFPIASLNRHALHLTSDNVVYAGGLEGMVSFFGNNTVGKQNSCNLIFTNLAVNSKEILPRDELGILDTDIAFATHLTLQPNQRFFNIQYAVTDYANPFKCYYEIKLEGFNNEWINNGFLSSATYTNMKPGNYVFRVRAYNAVSNEMIAGNQLSILIETPLYLRWYAILLYFMVFLTIIFIIGRMYVLRVKLSSQLFNEKQNRKRDQELNNYKLHFFTNVSHEFKLPLTLIIGFIENILQEDSISDNTTQKLKMAYGNSIKLKTLINELIDFRKLEQGHLNLRIQEIELNDYIDKILTYFSELSKVKQIDILFRKIDMPVYLWFDPQQMEKVFFNLIYNAYKHVESGKGKIMIMLQVNKEKTIINIQDNGCGISEEKLEKLFDRFYHVDRVFGENNFEGSGIGLSLTKGIVEEHEGELLVSSCEGEGSEFKVILKNGNEHFELDDIQDEPAQYQSLQNGNEMLISQLSNDINQIVNIETEVNENLLNTILIVDDSQELRLLVKDIFQNEFRVIEAFDGREGMKQAMQHMPDIIISDVMMPNIDGIRFCKQIKNNIETCHIPVILLTAKSEIENQIEGVQIGADDYISKPFNSQLLKACVNNLLTNRKIIQEKYNNEININIKELITNALDQEWLIKAEKIIEANLDDTSFNLEKLASNLGMGKTKLYTKIKSVTGITPNNFIQTYRLKKAALWFITDPVKNITETAYEVGFNSPGYFSRCFRKQFGVSPKEFIDSSKSGK